MILTLLSTLFLRQPVDFQAPAGLAKVVLPALGKKIGTNLMADPAAGSIPILIQVHNAEKQRLLDQIAKVTGCSWRQEKGGLLLKLDVRSLETQDAKQRVEALTKIAEEKSKEGIVAPLSKIQIDVIASSMAQNSTKLPATYNDLPVNRAARRLLTPEFITSLARIKPGERVLFSESPDPLQVKLPPGIADMLHEFKAETEAIDARIHQLTPGFPENLAGIAKPGAPETAVVVALRLPDSDILHISYGVASGEFRIIPLATMSLLAMGEPDPPAFADAPLVFPAELTALAKYFNAPWNLEARPSKETCTRLADPVRIDPQEIMIAPIIRSIGEAASKDIVAYVPDRCLTELSDVVKPDARLKKVIESLGAYCAIEVDGNTLLFSPRARLSSFTSLWNRDSLRTFIRTANSDGGISMLNVGSFLVSQPDLVDQLSWPGLVFRVAVPRPDDAIRLMDQSAIGSRLLSALTPSEFSLGQSEPLPLNKLSAGAVAALWASMAHQSLDEPAHLGLLIQDPSQFIGSKAALTSFKFAEVDEPVFIQGSRSATAAEVASDVKQNPSSKWLTAEVQPFRRKSFTINFSRRNESGEISVGFNGEPLYEELPMGPAGPLLSLPPAWRAALQAAGVGE